MIPHPEGRRDSMPSLLPLIVTLILSGGTLYVAFVH
jgi:hypothetical protein